MNQALSFDGFTGPYLEYSLARINSILKKTTLKRVSSADFSTLRMRQEKGLIFKLMQFGETVALAQERHDPSHLAKYLYELAKNFSEFYETCPILKAENPTLRAARLNLARMTKIVLSQGLEILGLPLIKEM